MPSSLWWAITHSWAIVADSFITSPRLPVRLNLALAGRQHRFDVEDVAADLRPCQARHNADHAAHLVLLPEEVGHAEDLLDLLGRNLGR